MTDSLNEGAQAHYEGLARELEALAFRAAHIDDPLLAARIQEAADLARERFFGIAALAKR